MLSDQEIELILLGFPKFERCYERITHNKVLDASLILAIPEGKKCFAWFTVYKNENVCFLLDINEKKQIVNIKKIDAIFDNKLSLGTIFYGTVFNKNNISYFFIEDLYYYKGKNWLNSVYLNKLETIRDIFRNNLNQTTLDNSMIFGLPLISSDFQLMIKDVQLLPYKVDNLKFRFNDIQKSKKIVTMKYFKPSINKEFNKKDCRKDSRKEAIFKIMADIEPDIYNLFIYKDGIEEYYDSAFISDYKTSVMMNKLFRNIKENENLDAIEESDDEEDFEDIREDKYVYLDRSFNMICEYNSKFKRWCPIRLADKNDKIISSNILYNILSKQK
jgi:hypothetical protein